MKLLIVEENEAMCRLVRGLVEGLFQEISECRDGKQALARCAELKPDWVLLDLNLAGLDTFGLARQMTGAGRPVRVLLLGEEDDVRFRDLASRAGAWGYVLKQNLIDLPALLQPSLQSTEKPQEEQQRDTTNFSSMG